jgi:NADH-quinone oxidoreductase subunit H
MNASLAFIAALISLVVASGSLDIGAIIIGQGMYFSDWYAVRQPAAFLIVCFATLAASMRPPFDAPHSKRELIAGYMTDSAGGSVVLFTAAHYMMVVVGSMIITALFLGGGFVPGLDAALDLHLTIAAYVIAFIAKMFIVMLLLSRVRRIVARMRLDQFMHVGWKMMLPLAAFNLVITIVVYS